MTLQVVWVPTPLKKGLMSYMTHEDGIHLVTVSFNVIWESSSNIYAHVLSTHEKQQYTGLSYDGQLNVVGPTR